jgi:CRISPR/Cas system CSM-associated protein Csm5 (group 7 of RAMP superfamily)
MDTLNQKFTIEITVLSPLSIGAGAEKDLVKGVDFVVKDEKVYVLNMKKILANGIKPDELSSLFASKNHGAVLQKVKGKLGEITDAVFSLPANSDNDIKTFIKNQLSGRPIIPGSSLKGAVRSVILNYLLNGQKHANLKEKDYFGDSNKGDELMRFIKFSDAEFKKTELVNTKIFNLYRRDNNWRGGWKHSRFNTNTQYQETGFNTLYEAILPGQKGLTSIMLSEMAFRKIPDQRFFKNKQNLFNIHELFNTINQHSYDYIDKEVAFFNKYDQTDCQDKIKNNLISISNKIPDESDDVECCILKMSAGSGFHSITGDWQYDDYTTVGNWNNGKHKYKSRKIAIHNNVLSLMGFIKLQVLNR